MSSRHPWLTFVVDGPGPWLGLDVDVVPWQEALVRQNARWYPGSKAPQVAAAFVLQYLLQVPAHTLAYAVGLTSGRPPGAAGGTGGAGGMREQPGTHHRHTPSPGRFRHLSIDAEPFRHDRPAWTPDPARLTFRLGTNHVPEAIRLPADMASWRPLTGPGASSPEARSAEAMLGGAWEAAERDYRAVAEPLATAYEAIVHLGSGTRLGMVTDLWRQAVHAATGQPSIVQRDSCCFLYALPGCHECAGCPRLRTAPQR